MPAPIDNSSAQSESASQGKRKFRTSAQAIVSRGDSRKNDVKGMPRRDYDDKKVAIRKKTGRLRGGRQGDPCTQCQERKSLNRADALSLPQVRGKKFR
jgi:hypothetical protein